MQTTVKELQDLFKQATLEAFPGLLPQADEIPFEVVQSTQEKFGHYQYNTAMKLAKPLGLTPRNIAEAIVKQVNTPDMIAKMEIAGPGFINITLQPSYISQNLTAHLRDLRLGIPLPKKPQNIVIDFSSPNVAKEMHVGHLRSTIIGDSLARLYEFLGHKVLRLNHIGDWGTAFGMLIAYMKQEAPEVLTGNQHTDLTHLVSWYKASKLRFDNDPAFKKQSQLEVVSLQSGDPESLKAWGIICEISRKAYQEIYDLLNVHLEERGESYYNSVLGDVVKDLENRGIVTLSDGAKCIFIEGFQNREGEPLPLMIQKSDGGYNYDTTDMAAIKHRLEDEQADHLIYVTDAGQSIHFQMIFKAAELAGYLDPKRVRVDHVPFGLVLGADGKKFKTRSGDTERLIDLLTTAVDHAKQIFRERSPELPEEEVDTLSKALGISAVKYADLSCNRTGDYTFSYERMLKFEGNTAAFLMYSYVRVNGIKRKVHADVDALIPQNSIQVGHPSEIALGVHLLQFAEALEFMAKDLLPNRLTDYLYGLAEKFNAFFRDCRVEGSEEEVPRLLLCELTARTLRTGMDILGLRLVERM